MSDDPVQNEKISTRNLVKQYVAHWKLFTLAAALSAVIILMAYHHVELEYTGTTKLERRMDPVSTQTSTQGSESFGSRKKTLRHDLASWEAVEEAVKQMEQLELIERMERSPIDGSYSNKGEKAKQQKVLEFERKIDIQWEVSSEKNDLVAVSFTHSDPKLAEQMPNTLVDNYINRVSKQAEENWKDSKEFYTQRKEACESRLAALTEERIEFEKKHRGSIPESSGILRDWIFQIDADLEDYRLRHEMAKQALTGLQGLEKENNDSTEDPNEPREIRLVPNPLLEHKEKQLQATKDELQNFIFTTTAEETHPTVIKLRKAIETLEKQIEETEPLIEPKYAMGRINDPRLTFDLFKTQISMEGIKTQIARLEGRRKDYVNTLKNFGAIRPAYQELNEKIEGTQKELDRWRDSLQSAEMALAAERAKRNTHLNAVQAALKQYRPSEPKLLNAIAIALMGGIAFGGLLVFLAIRIDQTIITPEQAAKGFGIPVYGFVGVIMTPRALLIRTLKRWIITPAVATVLIAVVGICTFSLTLRLQHPDEYKSWKKNEIKYLTSHTGQLWNRVKANLSSGE